MKRNPFWSTYKKIEEDVLNLSYYLDFSEKNKGAYSSAICDLILRCASEIESISKELYKKCFDNSAELSKLKFDYDCIETFIKNWRLDVKQIEVQEHVADFNLLTYTPFKKITIESKECFKWNFAYQSLKHNKIDSIADYANIDNLFEILSALYILNLFYKDEVIKVNYYEVIGSDILERIFNSKIFRAYYYVCDFDEESDEKRLPTIDNVNIFYLDAAERYRKELLPKIDKRDGDYFEAMKQAARMSTYYLIRIIKGCSAK